MFALKSAKRLSKALRVEWEDGLAAQFTYVWLRDNCRQRPSLLHLDLNTRPQEVETRSEELCVLWPPFLPSHYSSQFLRSHSQVVKPKQLLAHPPATQSLDVPWRLQRRPQGDDFSHMALVHWGDRAREPATVWPFLDEVPSVVALENVSPSSDDARVLLVDGAKALERLAHTHEEHFNFLLHTPVQYEGDCFKAAHHIASIHSGRVHSVVFNNEDRSSEITVAELERLYAALKAFNSVCCDEARAVSIKKGELLVVDNSRTLVGAPAQAGRKLAIRVYK